MINKNIAMKSSRLVSSILLIVLISMTNKVKAELLLEVGSDDLIYVNVGEKYEFSIDISECTDVNKKPFVQVDLMDQGYSEGQVDFDRPDPMFMMSRGLSYPQALYSADAQKWIWSPQWAEVDEDTYELFRPYHRIVIDNRECSIKCSSGDDICKQACEQDKLRGDVFKGVIYNVELFYKNKLNAKLRARCTETPPCPEPKGNVCSSKGTCSATGVCECESSYGDVACDVSVIQLENGIKTGSSVNGEPFKLSERTWNYFAFIVKPSTTTTTSESSNNIIVEMTRSSGDPILFVKRAAEGTSNGGNGIINGIPTTRDFESMADVNAFRSRLDDHHIEIQNAVSGLYYVGVFNNNQYLKEESEYYVRARWSAANSNVSTTTPMCPFDCSGADRGTCEADIPNGKSVCACKPNQFGGEFCQGKVIKFEGYDQYRNGISGTIAPGDWNYIEVDTFYFSTKEGLSMVFSYDGVGPSTDNGHPLLVLKYNEYPTYQNADAIMSSTRQLNPTKEFLISSTVVNRSGKYYIGILNINYYVHNTFTYNVLLKSGSTASKPKLPNFISVSLVMIFSLFMCMLIALAKRIVQNRQLARMRALRAAQIAANPELAFQFGPNGQRRVEQFRGTPQDVISRIPIVTFRTVVDEEQKRDDCDYSCAVCLDDFENGDRLRQLVVCSHQFHTSCLDEWLCQHDNCPLCRAPVSSTGTTDDEQTYFTSPTAAVDIELANVLREPDQVHSTQNRLGR